MSFVRRHWRPLLVVAFVAWSWNVTGALWKPLLALLVVGLGLFGWWARRRLKEQQVSLAAHGVKARLVELARILWSLLRAYGVENKRKVTLSRQWVVACQARGLTGGKAKLVPNLYGVKGTLAGDLKARIAPGRIGVDVDDVAKNASIIGQAVGCRDVLVRTTSPGCAELTFYWSDPLGRILPVADLPPAPKGRIAYGIKQDGSAASIELGLSILLGGLTRHGKSNTVWALLADLIRQNIPTDLYVSDPKEGMELRQLGRHVGEQMGCIRVRAYVTTPEDTVKLVQQAAEAMRGRMRQQAEKNWNLSKENPLVLIVLDELLPLHAMIKKKHEGDLGKILYTGAGAGFMVVANAQVGHTDILTVLREMIPQRLCFRTKTPDTTDTILGRGSESRGATCSKITERGVAFAEDEFSSGHERVRAALVKEPDMDRIAVGGIVTRGVKSPVALKRCAVYRAYNADHALLYVGISQHPRRRFAEHARDEAWWRDEVVEAALEVVWLADEKAARREEARAIRDELPRFNVVHNRGWNPLRRQPKPPVLVEAAEPAVKADEWLSVMGSE